MTSSKPIVEVYQNVHEAADEREPFDNEIMVPSQSRTSTGITSAGESEQSNSTPPTTVSPSPVDLPTETENPVKSAVVQERPTDTDATTSDTEVEYTDSDQSLLYEGPITSTGEDSEILSNIDLRLELPKHERSSMMKMLTNFWAERSASGWAPLDYPL